VALLWEILQFVLRLSFGMSLAMMLTSSKVVTSGFFRVHLWVIMGLNVFGVLVIWTVGEEHISTQHISLLTLVIVNAIASYVGASIWIYEKDRAGTIALLVVTILTLTSAYLTTRFPEDRTTIHTISVLLEIISSGALLGAVMMSMLLGHWYLNTPGMKLDPLHKLLAFCLWALAIRTVISATGSYFFVTAHVVPSNWWIFVSLRWITGVAATLIMVILAKFTLRVPNTQSATGILYAATVVVLVGELTAQLLSDNVLYPL
jgi:protein NrfD